MEIIGVNLYLVVVGMMLVMSCYGLVNGRGIEKRIVGVMLDHDFRKYYVAGMMLLVFISFFTFV